MVSAATLPQSDGLIVHLDSVATNSLMASPFQLGEKMCLSS
ncbi:Uncharacterised protein [Vibrio cholerae]|nr:hypothetical protein VP96_01048 [Vibrio cholerae]CSB66444.1 Uncharacterised protein [Vibrio cholerae]CSI93811.1 Uncharacterised protein [Vibrio cholerae]